MKLCFDFLWGLSDPHDQFKKQSSLSLASVVSGYSTKATKMILEDCALFKKCLLYIDMSETKLCVQKFLLQIKNRQMKLFCIFFVTKVVLMLIE